MISALNIYKKLKRLGGNLNNNDLLLTSNDSEIPERWAEVSHINTFMNQAIMNDGESLVHYVSPIKFGFCTDEAVKDAAKHICKRITSDKQMINDHYVSELDKPFIFVGSMETVLAENATDINRKTGGPHWVSWVLLPKYYRPLSGKEVTSHAYQVYFFGSLAETNFPDRLKHYLTNKLELSGENDESEKKLTLEPLCNESEIVVNNFAGQQINASDCGWWACYYALMIVYTGNVKFLKHLKGKQLSAMPLRKIMSLSSADSNQLRQVQISESKADTLDKDKVLYFPKNNSNRQGIDYELGLSMLFLKRATELSCEFKLATESKEDDKFDDLSIEFSGIKGGKYFLQAKHKDDLSKKIVYEDLISKSNTPFSLQKYFNSFRKIKSDGLTKNWDNARFIICTTLYFDEENLLLNSIEVREYSSLDWIFKRELGYCKKIIIKDKSKYEKLFWDLDDECWKSNTNYADIDEFLEKLIFVVTHKECVLGNAIKDEMKNEFGQRVGLDVFNTLNTELTRWMKYRNKKGHGFYLTQENNLYNDAKERFTCSSWFKVRKPVASFTGREKDLENLHEFLQCRQTEAVIIEQHALVSGLGGIGKSELARKYAHVYGKHYKNNVIWIDAEKVTIAESFEMLADTLHIDTSQKDGTKKEMETIVIEIYKYFSQKECLFIFDNVEEYRDIEKYLPHIDPNARKPFVLITTRNRELLNEQEHGSINKLQLGVLPREKAIEFVKRTLNIEGEEQDEEIKELVGILGCLPLALQHAVAYIKESDYQNEIGTYLNMCKKSTGEVKSLLDREGLESYDRTIFITLKIAVEKIWQKDKFSLEILSIIAYFAPENIPKKTFLPLALSKIDEDDMEIRTKRSEKQLTLAVKLLEKYSMIDLNTENVMLSIHRLLQQVIRLSLCEKDRRNETLGENDSVGEVETLRKALELINNVDKWERNKSHVTSIWSYCSSYGGLIDDFYFINNSFPTYHYNDATPLHLLAEGGNAKEINSLLGFVKKHHSKLLGKFINAKDNFQRTPLFLAAEFGCLDVVKILVAAGAEVDTKSDITYTIYSTKSASGWSPLSVASFKGHKSIVEYLIVEGRANPDTKDSLGRTPMVLAALTGQVAIFEFLAKSLMSIERDKHLLHAKFRAIENSGDKRELMDFIGRIDKCQSVEILNAKIGEWTPLHLAAFKGDLDIAKLLIENGAIVAHTGFTQLHAASSNGHLDVVKLLISQGANPNDVNEEGWTSLHGAAQNGQLEIVKYFIEELKDEKSIDVNVLDGKRDTPLHTAAYHGKINVVKYLLKNGARINCMNKWGITPLFYAGVTHRLEVIWFFLKRDDVVLDTAVIDVEPNSFIAMIHLTVMHLAAVYDDVEIIKILVEEKHMDVDVGKSDSITPLHVAALFGNSRVIKYLLEHNADINALSNHIRIVDALSESIAQINKPFLIFNFLILALKAIIIFCKIMPSSIFSLSSLLRTTPNAISKSLGHNDPLLKDGSTEQGFLANKLYSLEFVKDKISALKDFVGIKECEDPRDVKEEVFRALDPFYIFYSS